MVKDVIKNQIDIDSGKSIIDTVYCRQFVNHITNSVRLYSCQLINGMELEEKKLDIKVIVEYY